MTLTHFYCVCWCVLVRAGVWVCGCVGALGAAMGSGRLIEETNTRYQTEEMPNEMEGGKYQEITRSKCASADNWLLRRL